MLNVSLTELLLTLVKCFQLPTSSLARTPLLPSFLTLRTDQAAADLQTTFLKEKFATIRENLIDSEESYVSDPSVFSPALMEPLTVDWDQNTN